MATFTVTNLGDSGAGSLRAAITAANAEPPGTSNTIEFTVSGTITLTSTDLPAITNPTLIVAGNPDTGNAPTVGIDFNGHAGLVFALGSDGSQLVGLALGNAAGNGVTLDAGNIILNNNYVGLALDGSALGNSGDGVFVSATSSANQIGYNPDAATLAEAGQPASGVVSNVISGNGGNGISLHGSADNIIVSNRIGTTTDGNAALANGGNGIWVTDGSTGNTIGGTVIGNDGAGDPNNPTGNEGTLADIVIVAPPLGNLVSGNAGDGIRIDTASANNILYGNFVGTAAGGTAALGNQGDGVAIVDADFNSLHGCTVTDNPFVYYNVVSGNAGNGIHVTDSDHVTIRANFVGFGADNATIVANTLDGILIDGSSRNTQVGGIIPLGNVVSGNGENGIEVAGTASGFSTLNTFAGTSAFFGVAPNGNNGILITSTGGNQTVQTNVISGNANNGLEISGDAWGVTVVPNIIGLDTRGDTGGAFGNGNNGILITGNAHDNIIGGSGLVSNLSVIRQNTISSNANYGIVVSGQAYNNTIADGAVGTDIQELAALPNGAGGILLNGTGANNVVGTAVTGWSPLASPAERVNVISGNDGNGVTIAPGVNGDAVINNWIGLNILGQPSLPNSGVPIDDNGGVNLIYGNSSTGPLPLQSPTGQLEVLYIGWYGRAADPAGFDSQMQSFLTQILNGASISAAALVLSQGFATSPESAEWAPLASPIPPVNPPTPQQAALFAAFVETTFENLFDRPATVGEIATWSGAFFSGTVPFSDLVYDIASAAQGGDITAMNAKIQAASYFTTAAEAFESPATLAEMQAAVSGVSNATTLYTSEAATDALAGASHNEVTYQSILSPLDIITGVRADLDGAVILTGSQAAIGTPDTQAFLYQGALNNTDGGTLYVLTPTLAPGITSATFYGPDTAIFTPGIGVGNVRAVGSYQYAGSPSGVINHGMMYQGRVDGIGGTWTAIDVPSNGVDVVGGVVIGTTVEDTILHSTMGELIVGNYDLVGPGGTFGDANGFIYNITSQQYTLMNINGRYDNLTSLYGIWENGVGSTSYTLAGGTANADGVNVAFLIDYDSTSGTFANLTYFTGFNRPGLITHFENITAVPGGYNLVATTDDGPAAAFVARNADGTFGEAIWTDIDLPGSNLLTGNIAYQNIVGGIYNTDDQSNVASYLGVVDLSHVDIYGGLIMPVGSYEFAYSLTAFGSTGADIIGSATAGNVLGGSIGNDRFSGTASLTRPDTIFTGGGADTIELALGHTARTRVELFAGNSLATAAALAPGSPVSGIAGSIVSADDIPQLGWWGQGTGQIGGPVSDTGTNAGLGSGVSGDMSTVVNFVTGSSSSPIDIIDISLDAFSDLVRSADGGNPAPGAAVFSNVVAPGGTITVGDANVIVISSPGGFGNAADLAAALLANPITFAASQTAAYNHYIVAYEDFGGNVRIADMDIHRGSAPSFTSTANGETLSISDMAQLTGVSLSSLQQGNINFLNGMEVAHSSYLDFTGYRITDDVTVEMAYRLDPANVRPATEAAINVAIVLDRMQDPTALLSGNWGERQQALEGLNDGGTLWSTYGANQTQFNAIVSELRNTYGLTVLDGTNSAADGDYVSSAASRTIWVELNTASQFASLFGTTLYVNDVSDNKFVFWNGNLLLPTEWNVQGLWFDMENSPPASNLAPLRSVTPGQGAQSAGNDSTQASVMSPQEIAAHYNLPLTGQGVATGAVAVVAPGIGSALPSGSPSFQQQLAGYLAAVGETGTGTVSVQGENGQQYSADAGAERSLDVGVLAAVNPGSNLQLYAGSGYNGNARASAFTALQSAIWDTASRAAVISNSFADQQSPNPDSPFYEAYRQLFVDAALNNQTVFSALGDFGSSNDTGNGLTNFGYSLTSPYAIMVGGTSLSTLGSAEADPTILASIVNPALAGDPGTIWQLVAGGLRTLPADADSLQAFVESVWNQYFVDGTRITGLGSTAGGVDPTQPVPSYQAAYGLAPVTAGPQPQSGRGAPDVSANAGGNAQYLAPTADMGGTAADEGTGATAPLWAALTVQLNAIFDDQGLPELGYMNDLLYIASAIAPASFNDVGLGNNTSSFSLGGAYSVNGTAVTPTGYGYTAGAGYDLTSGLGTPNGLLLARALTAIAHSQVSFSSSPDMLDADGNGWQSGADQSLLFQTMSSSGAAVGIELGSDMLSFSSGASGTYAWSSRLAQQSLQADFDPGLVRMFDKYGQGALMQSSVSAGEGLSVAINASAADAIQGTLSSPFGFADFMTGSGAVRVARAVAVAETAGGQDDQTAIVRVRQNGEDSLSIDFYRVDDLSGSINGLQPGQAGYAAAAQARAYQIANGGTSLDGPGYGDFAQAALLDVDAGDLIAMKLVNHTSHNTYWAFSQANESVGGQPVGHLWNYGLNTWGWEDQRGGGDRDFNDMLVQFDFTSAAGHGWLT